MTTSVTRINRKKISLRRLAGALLVLLIVWQNGFCGVETRENRVVKAVRKASPAVVNISSQYEIRKNSNPFSGYGMDPLLDQFFRDFFSPELERREKRTSLGSGVIIDGTRGLVLTNTHVVEKATTIKVALNDQREFEAAIIGMDPDSDLAVLKIHSEQELPAIQMGHSDDLMIGESVIAIGNPFGFSNTVTTGVISSINRSIKTGERVFHKFIQTDASINPGNSGGPLLNINGALIGINTAIYAQAQGIGFAIPINRAKRIISDLINFGEVVHAWVGMMVQPLDSTLSAYLEAPGEFGLMVSAVEPESPAARAGLVEGDIILSVDGVKLTDMSAYQAKMNEISAGQTLSVETSRKGTVAHLSIKTAVYPLDRALALASQRLGIKVTDIDEPSRSTYGIKTTTGVLIIEIRRNSHLGQQGVRPGDVIRQIDEQPVERLADFKAAIIKYRNKPSVVLLVQRHGHLYYVNTFMKERGS
jgi:Do/DeqQ family serine protease